MNNIKVDNIPDLVSVIVASYNHAEFLEQRMNSLIHQTYKDIEIIVIDDCSTDNSVEVLNKYKDNRNVNVIINENNLGWVGVSNLGISLAKGEYIIFANCDDYAEKNQIELLFSEFNKNKTAVMCFSKSFMIDKDDNVLGDDYTDRSKSFQSYCHIDVVIPNKKMVEFLMHSCVIPNLSGVLIKKEYFILVNGFSNEYKVVSDWDLFFRLSKHGETIYINQPLNYFRQHNETIRATTKDKRIYEEIFLLLYRQFEIWGFSKDEEQQYLGNISSIWVSYFVRSSFSAITNFLFHFKICYSFNKYCVINLVFQFFKSLFNKIKKA